MNEMPCRLADFHIGLRKIFTDAVRPLDFQHRVMPPPKHASWQINRRLRRQLTSGNREAGLCYREIPIEPALDIARLHEIIDECVKIFVECGGVSRPMGQKVAEIESATFS